MEKGDHLERKNNFKFLKVQSLSEEEMILPMLLAPYHVENAKLTNLKAICHFVHSFPFTESHENYEYTATPNHIMTKRNGNKLEHALLLACILMGIKDNKEAEKEWNEQHNMTVPYVKIRDRVFVCLGLDAVHKRYKQFWVMNFSDDLRDIIFWDVATGLHFIYKDRVREDEVKK